jgi:hypothetical protein
LAVSRLISAIAVLFAVTPDFDFVIIRLEIAGVAVEPIRADRYRRSRESVLSRRPINQRTTPVSELTVAEATENIYASLRADNAELDAHIAALKAALTREGIKQAVFDPTKLAQGNRSGRKLMQAYFRQRGVSVSFSD